jgi:HPt (histidine-containing phosphotransfer) domain-containing protein
VASKRIAMTPPDELIDRGQYQAMLEMLGGDFSTIVHEFFQNSAGLAKRMAALAEAGDAPNSRELFHEIKGSSAMLGFKGVSEYAAAWENLAADGRIPDAAAMQKFSALLASTLEWVKAAA